MNQPFAIGEKTVEKIGSQVMGLLDDYLSEVNEAFHNADDSANITFQTKITDTKNGLRVETKIGFVKSKITATLKDYVNENQIEMFEAEGK
jgi:hypothetical protein